MNNVVVNVLNDDNIQISCKMSLTKVMENFNDILHRLSDIIFDSYDFFSETLDVSAEEFVSMLIIHQTLLEFYKDKNTSLLSSIASLDVTVKRKCDDEI